MNDALVGQTAGTEMRAKTFTRGGRRQHSATATICIHRRRRTRQLQRIIHSALLASKLYTKGHGQWCTYGAARAKECLAKRRLGRAVVQRVSCRGRNQSAGAADLESRKTTVIGRVSSAAGGGQRAGRAARRRRRRSRTPRGRARAGTRPEAGKASDGPVLVRRTRLRRALRTEVEAGAGPEQARSGDHSDRYCAHGARAGGQDAGGA